ncbi:MAG TPA: hypothetical protein VFQ40_07990 [Actinomycetota bacterium]|nr:hypothetical protein [Actinomycetota bacterium]
MTTAFTRGLAATWSSPVIVGALLGWIVLEWLLLVAAGYPGPFAALAYVSAPIPHSALSDLIVFIGILGVSRGLFFVFAAGAVHALWFAILTGLAVEAIETGRASRWGAIRGFRAFPVSFALHVLGVPVLFAAQLVTQLGGGFGLLLQVAILAAVTWLFGFAPVIAVAEHRRMTDALGRSVRAARLSGSGNLTFATVYSVPVYATTVALLFGSVPGADLAVNPPPAAWLFVLGLNLLHTAILAALAMRYLATAAEVPDAPPRRPSARDTDRPSARERRAPRTTRTTRKPPRRR